MCEYTKKFAILDSTQAMIRFFYVNFLIKFKFYGCYTTKPWCLGVPHRIINQAQQEYSPTQRLEIGENRCKSDMMIDQV